MKSPSTRVLGYSQSTREGHSLIIDLVLYLTDGPPLEGKGANEEDIEEHSNTPNIRLLMQCPLQGLRSHVVPRARYLLGVGVDADGSPEVDDLDVVVAISVVIVQENDIVQLDIAMDDPPLVQIGQSSQELLHYPHHQQLRKLLQPLDQIYHRSSPAELHHHVVVGLVVEYLIELYDVRMVQLREQTELGQKFPLLFLMLEDLDRSLLLGSLAEGSVDLAEGAFPDHLFERVEVFDVGMRDLDKLRQVDPELLEYFLTIDLIQIHIFALLRLLPRQFLNFLLDKVQHLIVVHLLLQMHCFTTNTASNLFLKSLGWLTEALLVGNLVLPRHVCDIVQGFYLQGRGGKQKFAEGVGRNILHR